MDQAIAYLAEAGTVSKLVQKLSQPSKSAL